MANGPAPRSAWDGLIRDRVDPSDVPSLAVIVDTAGTSWSSPVRVTGDDSRDYFVKFPELCRNTADGMSVATEMVVARAGRLIGAPTCEAIMMRIPDELRGVPLKGDVVASSTFVHASVALDRCDEKRPELPSRTLDDNRRRHTALFALFDWFMGSDPQWLRDLDDDMAVHSHDHGLYLPPVNTGHWTEQELQANVNTPWPLRDVPAGLSPAAIEDTARALRAVGRTDLQSLLQQVPASWPVTDRALEGLGWFLECRAPAVADRIEQLAVN